MDVQRTGVLERRRRRRWAVGLGGVAVVAAVSIGLSQLDPAVPRVDRDTVWLGTVRRGEMVREVRGPGTLTPAVVRWIPAESGGRVENLPVRPGQQVDPESVIAELRNPEVEQASLEAASAVRRIEAELEELRMRLRSDRLDRRAAAAAVRSDYEQAVIRAEADRELADRGLISDVNLRLSTTAVSALRERVDLEAERLESSDAAAKAQIEAKEAEVEEARTVATLRDEQRRSLIVRAGLSGIVQDVSIETGQRVEQGAIIARIAEPTELQAELRIPATQARDVQPGQAVSVDTRNGIVAGSVARLDPAVREGTVRVEVALTGALPRGARPDMAVDGTIEIERLENILFVERPAFGTEDATVSLFRVDDSGSAERVPVHFGRGSVRTIEVVDGLAEGDQVVLSDTSRWDDHDRITLR